MGYFAEASGKIKKKGVIYTYMLPEPSIASPQKGVGPLLYCISVVWPPRVIFHISRAGEKKRKIKEMDYGSP